MGNMTGWWTCGIGLCLLASFASAGEGPVRIEGGVVLVRTEVNGRGPFVFILDTGATETLVTPPVAKALGLEVRGPTATQKKAVLRTLAVGDTVVSNLAVFVLDPPQALSLRIDHGIDYHGILGATFLNRYDVRLDYPKNRLSLTPASRPPPGKTGVTPADGWIPFTIEQELIHVPGRVNGKAPLDFVLDTGSAEVLLLPRAARQLGISATVSADSPGVGFVRLESVGVGAARITQLPAIVHVPSQDRAAVSTYDGILGTPFLSNFVLTLDYQHKRLRLE